MHALVVGPGLGRSFSLMSPPPIDWLQDHPSIEDEVTPWLQKMHALVVGPGLGWSFSLMSTPPLPLFILCRTILPSKTKWRRGCRRCTHWWWGLASADPSLSCHPPKSSSTKPLNWAFRSSSMPMAFISSLAIQTSFEVFNALCYRTTKNWDVRTGPFAHWLAPHCLLWSYTMLGLFVCSLIRSLIFDELVRGAVV